jgi:molecular chaperone GrpE
MNEFSQNNSQGLDERRPIAPALDDRGLDDRGLDEHELDDQGPDDQEHGWHDRDELLLGRLRQWLAEARMRATEIAGRPAGREVDEDEPLHSAAGAEFGLCTLVEEFTALRHELKLQTKSTRGLEEESQSQSAALRLAIDTFHAVQPKEALAAWSAGKGLAIALVDLDESLDRGRTQIERAGRTLVDEPARALPVALDELYASQSWVLRLLSRHYHRQARAMAAKHGRKERETLFAALLEGYGLIQGRLTRALAADHVQRIATLGKPVDPERMIVVEVVEAPEKAPGTVVEEVRRGYTWNDRVLRCAEVRASREHPGRVLADIRQSIQQSNSQKTETPNSQPDVERKPNV